MPTEQVDVAELLIRRAGMRLGDAYSHFWEASVPGIPDRKAVILRTREAESCIEAILLFQSGMEAIINEEISTNSKLVSVRREREYHQKRVRDLSFKNKWENSFKALELEDDGTLRKYLEFYRDYRVPITHPRNRYFDVSPYRFPQVYAGIKSGWLAFMMLAGNWEQSARAGAWESFCNACNLPIEVSHNKS
ncbi:MAG: hypothetical protein N2691_03665 [Patescibacteria group bacterium]|nr:hypothetical protein [Patescibacteria group bacterium]